MAWSMGPTWGPTGADRTQVGSMLAPWTFLSWMPFVFSRHISVCTCNWLSHYSLNIGKHTTFKPKWLSAHMYSMETNGDDVVANRNGRHPHSSLAKCARTCIVRQYIYMYMYIYICICIHIYTLKHKNAYRYLVGIFIISDKHSNLVIDKWC